MSPDQTRCLQHRRKCECQHSSGQSRWVQISPASAAKMVEKSFYFQWQFYMLIIGGEWNYIIFSTVRSLPRYRIEKKPTLGWCKKSLGFISDEHQINVALTRARRGLIIIGWFF